MCQAPSPELARLLVQLTFKAAQEAKMQDAQKERLIASNKLAAREQLLRIQLELAKRSTK